MMAIATQSIGWLSVSLEKLISPSASGAARRRFTGPDAGQGWAEKRTRLDAGEEKENALDRFPVGETTPFGDVNRVYRGGSFVNRAAILRSADRTGDRPSGKLYTLGFRPARTFR